LSCILAYTDGNRPLQIKGNLAENRRLFAKCRSY